MFSHPLSVVVMRAQTWRHTLVFFGAALLCCLCGPGEALSQTNLIDSSCPTACGVRLRISSTKLRERANGIDAVVQWTVEQSAPEIKLRGFKVSAKVEFNRSAEDEGSVNVGSSQREAVITLQKSGKSKDIKFSDVTSVIGTVVALADALPAISVPNITSRKIVGEGGDSAVEVRWEPPPSLPCSAQFFQVSVSAINEKGDRLSGVGNAAMDKRFARVDLSGAVNKKGLNNPGATVKVLNAGISCPLSVRFNPVQEGFSSGTGANVPNPAVTLKPVKFSEAGGRIDMDAFWDVDLQGFKATKFDVKFEVEVGNGTIFTNTRSVSGTERTVRGPQAQVGDLRSVTVTINATFTNAAATEIVTRTDKRTQPFTAKSTLDFPKPIRPSASTAGLSSPFVKISTVKAIHNVTIGWVINPPSGVTITSVAVEATAAGNQNTLTRSTVVNGPTTKANINFTFNEVGDKLKNVQAKITADARRADGSTFQQTITGVGQPSVPAPPPPLPPVLLKIDSLTFNNTANNFRINGGLFVELAAGITIQNFIVEASILKPTGSVKKSVTADAAVRSLSVNFSPAEATGFTAVELKVTANLRRADGTTFQEVATRQAKP